LVSISRELYDTLVAERNISIQKSMNIPSNRDLTQHKVKLQTPEIRVWCHPHRIDKEGDDYFKVFPNFEMAEKFIKAHEEAEEVPLVAFRGYEINLYEIDKGKDGENE
jgi:hypothetical protein